MSIVKIESITNKKDLVGMFCCTDSIITDRPVGNPAVITKVSGQRVYYKFLPRRWIVEKENHVYQETFDQSEVEEKHCLSKSILYPM